MSDGLNLDGFATAKPAGKNNVAPEQYASAPRSAFPAKDVSTQGKAGFNAEGSYDTAGESNAYPESENM
jgi:hypothetical protein